jgi:hypothetical protein
MLGAAGALSMAAHFAFEITLTLTLSHEYVGEGTRRAREVTSNRL